MKNGTAAPVVQSPISAELSQRIQVEIQKSTDNNKGFFVILLQLENMGTYRNRRPLHVVNGLLREMYQAVRTAVHPSQYVGIFRDGLALVFDKVEAGQIDTISARLVTLVQHVIRAGKYNDLTSRWTDIIYEFLTPNKPSILYTRVGWSIYPRDGSNSGELVKRAFNHVQELAR